jgi:hypothetical protein
MTPWYVVSGREGVIGRRQKLRPGRGRRERLPASGVPSSGAKDCLFHRICHHGRRVGDFIEYDQYFASASATSPFAVRLAQYHHWRRHDCPPRCSTTQDKYVQIHNKCRNLSEQFSNVHACSSVREGVRVAYADRTGTTMHNYAFIFFYCSKLGGSAGLIDV